MDFSWYRRLRGVGEVFVEYPSASYGRQWLDVSLTPLDVELWAGRLHITLSVWRCRTEGEKGRRARFAAWVLRRTTH